MQKAVDYIRKAGLKTKRIAAEFGFLPYDASIVLRGAFPDADWVDALFVLERQRVKKSADELAKLKVASEAVLASMQAVIANHGPGATKAEVVEALRREETNRGLTFEYCLITCGTSMNRAPSDQKWEKGDIMSIDSGGNYHGYIGDICRMAIQGEPDAELERSAGRDREHPARGDEADQGRRHGPRDLCRRRTAGCEIEAPQSLDFLAHGMGLVSHEAPRLTNHGPVPYPATDADIPLEAGEVISVETTLMHPTRGFIKLEDTVVVTDTGHEIYGEGARGWNRGGTAVR